MINYLRRFKITARLNTLLAIVIIGFAFVLWLMQQTLFDALIESKKQVPQSVVELAVNLVEQNYQRAMNGEISIEAAQRKALEQVKNLRYRGSEYLWVNDLNHVVLMHPIKPELDGQNVSDLKDPNGKYLFREFVKVVEAEGEGFVDYLWPKPGFDDPVPKISFVKGFKPWGWVVGSGLYTDDVATVAHDIIITELIIEAVVVALVFVLLIIIKQSISQPMRETIERMRDIASGGGDLSKKLAIEGKDEVSELAGEFNTFINKLNLIMVNIADATQQLSGSVSTLSDAVDASSICADAQHNETDQTASAINQLSASAIQVAKSTEQASATSLEVKGETARGLQVVNDAVQTVSELAEEMSSTRLTIDNLKTETENIGSLLTVIRGIAEQTNLLALNAAIEAARAGEQGRGFAVVADEVRTLAGKTQQATEEIDQMIAKLQEGATSAVEAMERSNNKTDQAKQHARAADESLNTISSSIDLISDMNAQIATATEEQSQVSEEINQSVANVVSSAEENSRINGQVAESSADISQVRDKLSDLVSQFKT